jgi:hypothetical protein
MPRTIYKYPLTLDRTQKLRLNRVHEIYTVDLQRGFPVLWAMVNPDTIPVPVHIACLPTGGEGPAPEWTYISTVELRDGTVWHFFHIDGNGCGGRTERDEQGFRAALGEGQYPVVPLIRKRE